MAIANSYPMGTPKSGDLLLGTSVPRVGIDEKATTRNFGVEALATLVNRGYTEITKTLTNAEWIALPTTGIVVVPSVLGKFIQVLSARAVFTSATADAFFFTSNLTLSSRSTISTLSLDDIQAMIPQDLEDADGITLMTFGLQGSRPSMSTPLYFDTLSTATNSGGGTVSITVRYTLI